MAAAEPAYLGSVIGAPRAPWCGSRGSARDVTCVTPTRFCSRVTLTASVAGGGTVRVALYARVSTERQQERGTVGSQLEALRAAADADGHEVIEEFIDDGYSGARLDRPALDRLRDAAEAGVFDGVICLAADRLARVYAYQVLIIEELARFGVAVRFLEGPAHGEDPQATLLVQMQGVIAEYERAKIAERYRRGKLYRARQGEIPFWKTSYGHRRVVPADGGPARIEIFEPEAEIVRCIFDAYVEKGRSIRQIALRSARPRDPLADGQADLGHLYDHPAAEQRGVHRNRLLQPARALRRRRPARRAQPQDPQPRAPARGVDPDPRSGDRRSRHLRSRQAGQP